MDFDDKDFKKILFIDLSDRVIVFSMKEFLPILSVRTLDFFYNAGVLKKNSVLSLKERALNSFLKEEINFFTIFSKKIASSEKMKLLYDFSDISVGNLGKYFESPTDFLEKFLVIVKKIVNKSQIVELENFSKSILGKIYNDYKVISLNGKNKEIVLRKFSKF